MAGKVVGRGGGGGGGEAHLKFKIMVQEIVKAIIDAQAAAGGEAAGAVGFEGLAVRLQLDRHVGLPELRRHKRAFLKLATQNGWLRLRDAEGARLMFVEYLQENMQ